MINFDKNTQRIAAFTIVELLIVIVIIGILAAITIVSYTGITKKANEATVQADLANASKKIKMYYALYGVYPTAMPNDGTNKYCPSAPTVDTNYCIKPSSGTFFYTSTDPTLDYNLRADNGTIVYYITKDSSPISLVTTPITAVGAITGTAQTGQTLTAGAVTPGGATVAYQWQMATTAGGVYNNIIGATSNTFVVTFGQVGKYIKVAISGNGSYSGIVTSGASTIASDPNWITIGTQTWAKSNLNTGMRIPGTTAQNNNATPEKYCYGDSDSNCAYGGLYTWGEAMGYANTEGSRGICPVGSHIPSDNDWKILEVQLGMTQAQADLDTGWRGTDQATKLMSGGSSGLNIPLAGDWDPSLSFIGLSSNAYLWSSSETGGSALSRIMNSAQSGISRGSSIKNAGFSVRCLAD